jgi:hypothetical protein
LCIAQQLPPSLRQRSREYPLPTPRKFADSLRAGPVFVTKNATLLDWPSTPGGEYRVLRKGLEACP